MSVVIAGIGAYVPEKILTNGDLERLVDTNDEWIRTRTGIQERRIAAANEFTSDMAFIAATRAIQHANVDAEEIDAIIVATTSPDQILPNTACVLAQKLGITGALSFDLMAACSGLLYSLEVGFSIMTAQPARYRNVLVCGAEKLSSITNWSDRNTCVLFGDGAGAVVLSQKKNSPDSLLASDMHSEFSDVLQIPAGGSKIPASMETVAQQLHTVRMAGRETFKLAVTAMAGSCRKVLKTAGVDLSEVKLIIPHQANIRIIQAVASRLGVEESRVYENISRYGNTSAASIAICLYEAVSSGIIQRGDLVLLTAFGGGLTWGAMLIRY